MKTKTVHPFILTGLFVLLSVGITSCNSCSNQQKGTEITDETIREEIEEYSYPLPSLFEVTNMLNEIEASYTFELGADPEKADEILAEKERALNLGVYTADLAYATTYNQKSEIQDYFRANEVLIRELDFTAAFEEDLKDRIEANLDNKEELVDIVTEMFQNAYSFLNKQGRAEVSYLILSGSVIEGLYLTTHISEDVLQNPGIVKVIMFQKEPLLKLQEMMEPYKDSDLLKESYGYIMEINSAYALEEGATSFSQEQLQTLTDTVKEIRNKIIQ